MDRATTLRVLPTLILLVLYPKPKVHPSWLQHGRPLHTPPPSIAPLCEPQYSLVNSACKSLTPWVPAQPSPPSPVVPGPPSLEGLVDSLHLAGMQDETGSREDCCRWLKEIDDICVCELLVQLPPFLARPVHNYTVVVDESCSVTFQCGSWWMQI